MGGMFSNRTQRLMMMATLQQQEAARQAQEALVRGLMEQQQRAIEEQRTDEKDERTLAKAATAGTNQVLLPNGEVGGYAGFGIRSLLSGRRGGAGFGPRTLLG